MSIIIKQQAFWLTNISNRNVSIADLALTVNAFTSVNLLDKKHYKYTLEQLEKSKKQGSIAKKRNKLKVREVEPEVIKMDMPLRQETYIPSRERSVFSIKEEKYEELSVDEVKDIRAKEEEYAQENAEIAELDNQPLIPKGK